jgi:hypothetical protein
MVLKGFLFILLTIFSGVFLIFCLVMAAIKFNTSGKAALRWMGGFAASLIVLIFSIYTLVNGVVGKAKELAGNIEEFGKVQVHKMDSLNKAYTNSKDSILDSEQVAYLMKLEPDSMKGRVPEQFYAYLGFRDYYRLPLLWPYSLHCMDSLGDGSLYDESGVQQFDVNDNGERSIDLQGIMSFAFNREYLVGSRVKIANKPRKHFFVFKWKTGDEQLFKTESEMMDFIREKGFNVTELKSCKDYYNDFDRK